MRKILTFAVAFALFATTQAFAIIGVGAHYVMNTGSLKSDAGNAYTVDFGALGEQSIGVRQEKADGLKGIGFKLWIDLLPLVDIEGTFNIAATRYQTFLDIPTITANGIESEEIEIKYTPDAPYNMIFGNASPIFGIVNGDLSITYPFELPVVPIRPYIGAGVSYFASIPLVNASFTKKMLESSDGLIDALSDPTNPDNAAAASEIGSVLAKTLKDESYTTGIGGHAIIGFRIKPPIIPLAVYTNGKYYFGGNTNSQFTQGFVLEVGGGFAL